MQLLRRLVLALLCLGLFLVAAASYQVNPPGAACFVAAVVVLVFAIFVLSKGSGEAVNRAFLYFSLSYVGYLLLVYLLHMGTAIGIERVKRPVWLLRNFLLLIPPATVYFTYRFLGGRSKVLLVLACAALIFEVPFMALNAADLYVTEYKRLRWTFVPDTSRGYQGPLYMMSAILSIYWITLSALAVLVNCFRPSQRHRRPQFVLFLAGWGIAVSLALLGYMPAFRKPWYPSFVGFTWSLFPIMLGIAIVRFSMFDIKIVIRRTLPYALGTGLIGALYAACLAGLEALGAGFDLLPRGADWVLLLILMGLAFQPVLEGLQRGLDRLFFRTEAEMDRFLSEAGARYRVADSPESLARMMAGDAREVLKLEGAAVLLGADRTTVTAAAPPDLGIAGLVDEVLPDAATAPQPAEPAEGGGFELPGLSAAASRKLARYGAKLLLAFGGEGTRGLLACREKMSHLAFSPRDRMFLKALTAQAGTALARLEARKDADQLQRLTDAVFESMTNAVAVLESDGRVHSCNPAFEKAFGTSPGDELRVPWLAEALAAGSSAPCEVETEEGTFLVSARPLEGELRRQLVVLTDVTELRRLQEVDRRRKALAQLGATISSINHEIGNIVSPLHHYIDRARRSAEAGDVSEYLDAAAERLGALDSLSRELRDYYREPALTLRSVPVGELVESALADLRASAGEGWVPPEQEGLELELRADMQKLKQVLLNVTKNAWEAMGGRDEKRWSVRAFRRDGTALIQVRDSGKGIGAGELERLFEPFFTTKRERGTGLGLAIARRIVEAHGAEIGVESAPGEGTTVTISWPLERE